MAPFRLAAILLLGSAASSAAAAPPTAAQIELGRHLFTRVWEPQPAGPESGDGLGPLFNGRSCAECHHQGGAGGSDSSRHNVQFIRPIVRGTESEVGFNPVSRNTSRVHLERSSPVVMLHRFGVRREYGVWRANEIIALTRLDPDVVSTFGFPPDHPVVRPPYNGPATGWTVGLHLDYLLASTPEQLSPDQRRQLLAFLNSLRAPHLE
jgi:hypothetical protein